MRGRGVTGGGAWAGPGTFATDDLAPYVGTLLWTRPWEGRATRWTLELDERPDWGELPEGEPGLDREETQALMRRWWSGEVGGVRIEGGTAMHCRALTTLAAVASPRVWWHEDPGWHLLTAGPLVAPVPGGNLDLWCVHAWRLAARAAGDIVRAVEGLDAGESAPAMHARMREAVARLDPTPAFDADWWRRAGPGAEAPTRRGGSRLYAWGVASLKEAATAAAGVLARLVGAEDRGTGPGGDAAYGRVGFAFLDSAAKALRLAGHAAWEVEEWAGGGVTTGGRAARQIPRRVAFLEPLARAPAHRTGGLLRAAAERCRGHPGRRVAAERLLEQGWRRYCAIAAYRHWGVEPMAGDHPKRCGRYVPPGAVLGPWPGPAD